MQIIIEFIYAVVVLAVVVIVVVVSCRCSTEQ